MENLLNKTANVAEESSLRISMSFIRSTAAIVSSIFSVRKALDTLQATSNLADIADIFDLTAEKATKLFGVFESSGGNIREAQESLATFNQRINDALSGKGEEAKVLFDQLGVSAESFAKLDVADRFYELITAVQKSTSPLGKLNLLMKAVGEDGGKNLSRILPLSSEEIRKIGDASVLTSKQLQDSRDAFRVYQSVGASISNAFRRVVSAIGPTITIIGNFINETIRSASDWIDKNVQIADSITDLAKQVTGWLKNLSPEVKQAIGAVTGLVAAFALLTTAITVAGVVYNFFFGGSGILLGALVTVAAGIALWVYNVGDLADAWKIAKRAVNDFWAFIKPILPILGILIVALTGPIGIVSAAIAGLVYYWDDVVDAVREFYQFIKPTLREVWNLIKLVGFGIRDALVVGWKEAVRLFQLGVKEIEAAFSRLTGGSKIDWSQVKNGIRDFVIYVQFAFSNIEQSASLAWSMIKYAIIVTLDEIVKHIAIVPIAITGAFIAMSKFVVETTYGMLKALVKGAGEAVEMIWKAIKEGKAPSIDDILKLTAISQAIEVTEVATKIAKEIEKAVGKVTLHNIEVDGKKIPVGLNLEGLQKERTHAFNTVTSAMKEAEKGFQQFKGERLLRNQIEDAMETTAEIIEKVLFPMFAKTQPIAGNAGKNAGMAFATEFGKEAKKLDATIFGSSEALSRMEDFRDSLQMIPKRPFGQQTGGGLQPPPQMVVVQNSPIPPNNTDTASLNALLSLVELTQKLVNKEGIDVIPGRVP